MVVTAFIHFEVKIVSVCNTFNLKKIMFFFLPYIISKITLQRALNNGCDKKCFCHILNKYYNNGTNQYIYL